MGIERSLFRCRYCTVTVDMFVYYMLRNFDLANGTFDHICAVIIIHTAAWGRAARSREVTKVTDSGNYLPRE